MRLRFLPLARIPNPSPWKRSEKEKKKEVRVNNGLFSSQARESPQKTSRGQARARLRLGWAALCSLPVPTRCTARLQSRKLHSRAHNEWASRTQCVVPKKKTDGRKGLSDVPCAAMLAAILASECCRKRGSQVRNNTPSDGQPMAHLREPVMHDS